MKPNVLSRAGFTLLEIMIVVAIIGLLAAIAVPNFVRARESSQHNQCIANLRQIDGAVQTWALQNNKRPIDNYALDDLKEYIRLGKIPSCPANGTYAPGATVAAPPTCTVSGHVLP